MRESELPEMRVSIKLGSALARLLEGEHAPRLQARCAETLRRVLATMGIPAAPAARLELLPAGVSALMQVSIDARECPCPTPMLLIAAAYGMGVPLGSFADPQLQRWLATAEPAALGRWLELILYEAISRRASVLLGPAQLAAYRARLVAGPDRERLRLPSDQVLGQVLGRVLDQRLSLADTGSVAEWIASTASSSSSVPSIAEGLMTYLQPNHVGLRMSEATLREMTLAAGEGSRDAFSLLRSALFYQLGVHLPDFLLEVDPELEGRSFALRINHLSTLPRVGLAPDECLTSATTDAPPDSTPKRARNPATGEAASIVARSSAAALRASGHTTWDAFGYMVLSLVDQLRSHAAYLLESPRPKRLKKRRWSKRSHRRAGSTPQRATPELEHVSDTELLTPVLRALVAEQVSIRDQSRIRELIQEFGSITVGSTTSIVFDDRLPVVEPASDAASETDRLTAFVRMWLKRQLSHHYAIDGSTLVAYVLDPELERELATESPTPERAGAIAKAVIEQVPERFMGRVLLTTINARPRLSRILRDELPGLPVLAYQELSIDTSIQTIGRISVD
ncbi:MAG: FHIPEP family type III secretion protein [Myxococcales bacterium]